MKIFKYVLPVLAVGSMMAFTACSDDDDNNGDIATGTPGVVNPSQVFTQGMPTQVDGMKFTTNDKGQVTEITEGFGNYKTVYAFDYTGSSAAAASKATVPAHKVPSYYDMTMTVTEGSTVEEIFYITLDENGFAKYAFEPSLDGDNESDEWWFGYSNDGRLNYMKRTEGDNEVTRMDYDAVGNITRVTRTDDEGMRDVMNILYTDSNVTSPIANKGAIMLFDDCFGVDMDEFAPAYYAGLLGKATASLPVSSNDADDSQYGYTFSWTISEAGFPESLVIRNSGNVTGDSPIFFNWF